MNEPADKSGDIIYQPLSMLKSGYYQLIKHYSPVIIKLQSTY